eukprot:EG_transcript_2024
MQGPAVSMQPVNFQPSPKPPLGSTLPSRLTWAGLHNSEVHSFMGHIHGRSLDLSDDDTLLSVVQGWQLMGKVLAGEPPSEMYALSAAELDGTLGHTVHGTGVPDNNVKRRLMRENKRLLYEYLARFPAEALLQQAAEGQRGSDDAPKVLMVTEKPALAKTIAEFLSGGRMRRRGGTSRGCCTYEFFAWWEGMRCSIRMTNVVGHLFALDFDDGSKRGDPMALFDAATVKRPEETTQKLRVIENLKQEAEDCDYLVLWLDCDREGENIAFEVISVVRPFFPSEENIFRAHFSALTQREITKAWRELGRPNVNLSLAVDARQELDLKIGVAFTRYLTRELRAAAQQAFNDWDLRLISYGPCQTPTLWFCVQRHDEIQAFVPEPFWTLQVHCTAGVGGAPIQLQWGRERTPDQRVARLALAQCQAQRQAVVQRVEAIPHELRRPLGLNTVQLLKAASTGLGLSPHKTMKTAETLYSAGFISYPRTETTRYPATFDVQAILEEHAVHPNWGKTVAHLLRKGPVWASPEGRDVGDHPPITPSKVATRNDFTKPQEWRLYEYITRHFIASLMPNMAYTEFRYTIALGMEQFTYTAHQVTERGFTFVMTFKYKDLKLNDGDQHAQGLPNVPPPVLRERQQLPVVQCQLEEHQTEPPQYLTESELITLMDRNGIGTDASIPTHIQNIGERRYITIPGDPKFDEGAARELRKRFALKRQGVAEAELPRGAGEGGRVRRMVPTPLGISLIHGMEAIDPSLVHPDVRAEIEREVALIAEGVNDKASVVGRNLQVFRERFAQFRANIQLMHPLFAGPPGAGGYLAPLPGRGKGKGKGKGFRFDFGGGARGRGRGRGKG